MDLLTLKELLPVMFASGVERFELGDCKIVFHSPVKAQDSVSETKSQSAPAVEPVKVELPPAGANASEAPLETQKVADVVVPQRLEDELSFDRILFHSVPDADDKPVPLTDDVPLMDPAVLAEGRPNG